jgi:acetyltransferase-like isoleucine patch superfamily enzyme
MKLEHDWFPVPVPPNVVIGRDSWLYSSFSFLHFKSRREIAVKIGDSCGIYNGCFFDLGPEGHVEVGDFTALVGVIFSTNGRVSIGDYCFMAHEVVIAGSDAVTPPRPQSELPRRQGSDDIVIGDSVWVGAGAILLGGATIGDGAVIGAGAVVNFEVPAMAIVAGNPARVVGSVPH